MSRYRVIFDVDTTDPDTQLEDVTDAAADAASALGRWLPGAWVDLDSIEELGT